MLVRGHVSCCIGHVGMLNWSRGHVELVTWAFLLVGSGVCYILMEIGGVVAALLVLFLSWWSPRKKRWC